MPGFDANSVLGQLAKVIDEIKPNVKQASKAGEPDKKTSHPAGSVDDLTYEVSTGEHARDNERDIQESFPLVDDDDGDVYSDIPSDHLGSGPRRSLTGGDAAVEKGYKGQADDPGTAHPASTDDGEKYSSLRFPEIYDRFASYANVFLGRFIDSVANTEKTASYADAAYATGAEVAETADDEAIAMQKFAAAHTVLSHITAENEHKADLVANYLYKAGQHAQQQAAAAPAPRPAAQPTRNKVAADMDPAMLGSAMAAPTGEEGAMMGGPPPEGGEPEPDGDEAGMNEAALQDPEVVAAIEELIAALQEEEGGADPSASLEALSGLGGVDEKTASDRKLVPQDLQYLGQLAKVAAYAHKKYQINTPDAPAGSQKRANRDNLRQYFRYIKEQFAA